MLDISLDIEMSKKIDPSLFSDLEKHSDVFPFEQIHLYSVFDVIFRLFLSDQKQQPAKWFPPNDAREMKG